MNRRRVQTERSLLLRADASSEIGIGHLMRSLALGQAWKDARGKVALATAHVMPALEARFRSEGISVVHLSGVPGSDGDAFQTADLARKMNASWIALDGRYFDSKYQQTAKASEARLLVIDDMGHLDHCFADVVLNQNIDANESMYRNRETFTRLLLGPRYVLLRREFLRCVKLERNIPEVARKLLVTFGGGDTYAICLKMIKKLQLFEDELEVVVVAGEVNNHHYDELRSEVAKSKMPMRLEKAVDDMSILMTWADLGLSASGSTSWELAFMRLPSLVLVLGEDQVKIAQGLENNGVAINLHHESSVTDSTFRCVLSRLMNDVQLRQKMSEKGRHLVDGLGAMRVVSVLEDVSR